MLEMSLLNPASNLTTNYANFYTTTNSPLSNVTNIPFSNNFTATSSTAANPAAEMMLNASVDAYDFSNAPCHPYSRNFNCSREKYMEFVHGPQRLPLHKALLVTIIFGGIFITGVLGNVLVCVVIVRHSMMHTATNYYLFSLALSDLLYLMFGLPAEVFHYWHQYPYLFGLPFCKIRAFISEAYVSVLTILAFSMERFLAICHPLHLYAMSGFKRALRIIAGLWILSFACAIPFGLMTDIVYLDYPQDHSKIFESAFCSMVHIPENFPVFELSFCVFFIIPMVLIIILYGRMGHKIRSRTIQQLGVQQGSMHRESRHQQSKKAVIRMLGSLIALLHLLIKTFSVFITYFAKLIFCTHIWITFSKSWRTAVVITFFVCWLPFHIQRLWFLYGQEYDNFDEINEWMFSITGFAYYVSCTINPILYNVMSHRYRLAFKDTLCGKRKSAYYNNGFARDQSSFRETTIATSLGGSTSNDRVHSVRGRSVRLMNNVKDRESFKSNNSLWPKKTEFKMPLHQDIAEDPSALVSSVVVDNGVNGRPKVYTEEEVQENLINKSNETCI